MDHRDNNYLYCVAQQVYDTEALETSIQRPLEIGAEKASKTQSLPAQHKEGIDLKHGKHECHSTQRAIAVHPLHQLAILILIRRAAEKVEQVGEVGTDMKQESRQ